jgi:hypothetical protein
MIHLPRKVAMVAVMAGAVVALGGGAAFASTQHGTTPAVVPAATVATTAATPAEPSASGTTEATTAETDGPGGHADSTGGNVDHQFNGNE